MNFLDMLFGKPSYKRRTVSYGKRRFRVEVADSFRKMMTGLMDHPKLPGDGGMLFVFGRPGRYGFWMLHMKFSIDIIWLDERGRVVCMWERAEPCDSIFFSCKTVTPDRDAKYVLEFNAGTASRLGIRKGGRFRL
jgi:hypothetical protein